MKPALAQVSTLSSPFDADIADYAAGKCQAVEIWLGKLEGYLESHSTDDVRKLLDEHQVTAPVASYQGGLLATQGDARREHWDHFARRLSLCQELNIGTLVVAADVAGPLSAQDLERVQASLRQVAEQAATHDVRIALEFQGQAAFCNNLETAVALVADVGSPHLGVCLDVFHFYKGPSKAEDLAYLSNENLFHVQLCDIAGTARELASDSDRIMPGDGDFMLAPLIDRLRSIEYQGHISIELMNPTIWRIPAVQFGEIGLRAFEAILG
jgi:sugar phosphate isomerase/epimerase